MLLERIQSLLEGPAAGRGRPSRRHVEDTLTDGYAHALALEGERLRLERRIHELAASGDADGELPALSQRLVHAEGELAALRGKLTTLRAHALH